MTASAALAQPVLERQGSILKYGGQPIRLVGYGAYGMVNEAAFDYVGFLNIIADQHGLNFVRMWVNYHWTNSLNPFPGPRGSYNIGAQDDAFHDRLRAFVCYAQQKGIIVQVCLFDGVALEGSSSSNRWPYSPYKNSNNSQPYLDSPYDFDEIEQASCPALNSTTPWWCDVNVPLIDRVVDSLGNFGNVIYEVSNEPWDGPGLSQSFEEAVIDRLRQRLNSTDSCGVGNYSGSKLISVNPRAGDLNNNHWSVRNPDVDVVAVHTGPGGASDYNSLNKPVIISNDGDKSQCYEGQCGTCQLPDCLPNSDRPARAQAFLDATFNSGAMDGHNHFEFLDKGINGSSWKSNPPEYDPRVGNINTGILNVLDNYADSFHPTGPCGPPPPGVYVDGAHQGCESGGRGCPYNTVSEANAAAAPGDTIIIAPGDYAETVTFTKVLRVTAQCGLVRIGP